MKSILAIAGFDTCGGAGIHADIKTIRDLGFHPSSAITVVTFQNTCGIDGIYEIKPKVVEKQILAVLDDLDLAGIKIGLVCSVDVAEVISKLIADLEVPKVVDPVIKATTGFDFAGVEVYSIIAKACDILTPNAYEASLLSGVEVKTLDDAKKSAEIIAERFDCSVVITGGSLGGKDVVFDGEIHIVEGELIDKEVHGTGCVYSSALTCYLAKGYDLTEACKMARDFVYNAVKNAKAIGRCLEVVDPHV
jgi:hydroxymethylpyrimidine/phosphomethylpyrimidine kinase